MRKLCAAITSTHPLTNLSQIEWPLPHCPTCCLPRPYGTLGSWTCTNVRGYNIIKIFYVVYLAIPVRLSWFLGHSPQANERLASLLWSFSSTDVRGVVIGRFKISSTLMSCEGELKCVMFGIHCQHADCSLLVIHAPHTLHKLHTGLLSRLSSNGEAVVKSCRWSP